MDRESQFVYNHEERLRDIVNSHWLVLHDTVQRMHAFVTVFASMVRREFYHSPFVLNCWRDKNFPLLEHAIQHVHLLAYGCAELTTDEIAISDNGRILVIDPFLHGEKRNNESNEVVAKKYAGYLRMLTDQMRLIFDSKEHPPTVRVLPSIAEQLREIQLCVDELCLALKAWGDTLRESLDVPNSRSSAYSLRLVYSERTRIRYATVLQQAKSVIGGNADLLSLCLETRSATLAGLYEVAIGFDRFNKDLNIFESLRNIHEESLKRFSTLASQGDMELLQLARRSIEWRLTELIPEAETTFAFSPSHIFDNVVECECYFQIRPEWGTAESRVVFQVAANAKHSRTFLHQVGNEVLAKAGWQVSESQTDNPPEILFHPIPSASISEAIMDRMIWDNEKRQLSISLNPCEVDEHLLRSIRFAYIRLLSLTEAASSVPETISNQFVTDLSDRRLIGLMEYANTTVRMRSTLEIDRQRSNMLTCIESANRVSGRPMRLEPIPIPDHPVDLTLVQERIVNLFHHHKAIPLNDCDPASIVLVLGSDAMDSELDFYALPDGFKSLLSWQASDRISWHGFTNRSFCDAINGLRSALKKDFDGRGLLNRTT